jgi:hypothetical protein
MDSNTVEHDILSKQTNPPISDSAGSNDEAIGEKPDGHETATNTTSLDQVLANITADAPDPVSQDVPLVNVLDYVDNHILLTQKEGHGNVSLHLDNRDTISDPDS